MTVKEMRNLISNLPDDTKIEINSIYHEDEWVLSPIAEAHYCGTSNKVCITPEIISV